MKREGKTLHFTTVLSATAFGGNAGFLIVIAALACILGAEIAGICILINKMIRARRARFEEKEEDPSSQYRNFSAIPFVTLGAIPAATYTTLTVLAVLTAVAAVVFLVMLIVFSAKGYSFVSADLYRARQERKRAEEIAKESPASTDEEDPFAVLDEQPLYDAGEEQRQYAYTEEDGEQNEDTLLPAVAEEQDNGEGAEDTAVEVFEGEQVEVITALEPAYGEPTVLQQTTSTVTVEGEPAFADGTRPYKVVEKVVTETYKEVYKETPPAQQAPAATNSATDAVMEKLADFLEYELQKRKESDAAEEEQKKDSVEAFAQSADIDLDEEDMDEDDEDELDTESEGDEGDGSKDDDEDSDPDADADSDLFTGNERIIGFDEETGCYIVAHYRKSFEAKLIQARPNIKKYYSELKNALLSYKGTKNRISWTADSFHNGRSPLAKINVKTRILELYLALDPASLEGTVYRGQDVGSKKKYADTPFRYKVRTPRKFKWAMELVARVCEEHGLSPIDIERVDYEEQYPFDTTENLVRRKLIKEYIRQEKPATSFELDPDHVPVVPEEDESVIPANANFTWEFDNERMVEQEPVEEVVTEEPAEEPVEEPVEEPAEQPAEEAPAEAPAATVFKETVKITEMRYTERYYADAQPTYQEVITTAEPIEAEAVPAEAVVETVYEAEPGVQEEENTPTESVEEQTCEAEVTDAQEDTADEQEPTEHADEAVDVWADIADVAVEPTPALDEDTDEEEAPTEELFFEDTPTEDAEATEDESEEEPVEQPVRRRVINPGVAVVDLCAIEEHFPADAIVKLDTLKAKGLILPTASTLKVYAAGPLSKSLTVEAHHFTLDAIKAISDADGDAIMIR